MLGTLAIAGLAATAAASGYAAYRAYTAVGSAPTRSPQNELALAVFVWSLLVLPVAGVFLAGGVLLAAALLLLIVALLGAHVSGGPAPVADSDVVAV